MVARIPSLFSMAVLFLWICASEQTLRCTRVQVTQIAYVHAEIEQLFTEATQNQLVGQSLCVNYGSSQVLYAPTIGNTPADKKLAVHVVCADVADPLKKQFVNATLTAADRKKGSDSKKRDREPLEATYKMCGNDEAGHIIAKQHGGTGKTWNLFGQDGDLNRRIWTKIDDEIFQFLGNPSGIRVSPRRYVQLAIAFVYQDSETPRRPSHYFFRAEMFEYKAKKARTLFGYLANENHIGLNINHCAGPNGDELWYVEGKFSKFYDKKSCRVVAPRPADMYGPQ